MRHHLLCAVFVTSVLAACGAQTGNQNECRMDGEACAKTTDCCSEFVCQLNACVVVRPTAARCGDGKCDAGEATTCCSDCGCPAGRACQANDLCAPPPASPNCGDGKCEAGETQATCCGDCGCPAGQACQGNRCMMQGTTLMWTVTNSCLNGESIQMRFFSETRNWVWPPLPNVFFSMPDAVNTQPLVCDPGERICLGGNQPLHGLFWGVDIDNSKGCANCCFICANQSVSSAPLTCN